MILYFSHVKTDEIPNDDYEKKWLREFYYLFIDYYHYSKYSIYITNLNNLNSSQVYYTSYF